MACRRERAPWLPPKIHICGGVGVPRAPGLTGERRGPRGLIRDEWRGGVVRGNAVVLGGAEKKSFLLLPTLRRKICGDLLTSAFHDWWS